MKTKLFTIILVTFINLGFSQINIIPIPVSINESDGYFEINNLTNLDVKTNDKDVLISVENFKKLLADNGISISNKVAHSNKNVITISLSNDYSSKLNEEGYLLDIKEYKTLLKANTASGIFNGLQTLRQLFPPEFERLNTTFKSVKIKQCSITDYPRFKWRGLHLDVSRHFFSVDDVKLFIDKMSQYKFNVFHWHLTDDEGWRIEIKSLPKLTEVGAWRVERFGAFGKNRAYPKPNEKPTYGGFYTHEEIKDVVMYASERNITIVPEIDMPGHSMAALAAYPILSTKKEPKFVNPGSNFAEWYGNGKFKMLIENTLNPTDEKVYEFVDKVFTEVAELFPGDYIHMGGDECYKGYWEEDENVQTFMKQHQISDTKELQSYFVKRVEKIINSKGKKLIGWDEILEGGLAKGATVMSWRGMKGGIEAAEMGHDVVMTPTTYAYLDYTQGDFSVENKVYNSLSLEKCYEFEPIPDNIDPKYVLGGQGNVWTEKIPTMPFAFYMTYPRAFALSETFWSKKEDKNWNDFISRVEHHFERFEKANQNISKAVLDPIIKVYYNNEMLMCELKNSIPNTDIYYTIDNTYPVKFGIKYSEPFAIPDGDFSLRTQTLRNKEPLGRLLQVHREELVKRVKN